LCRLIQKLHEKSVDARYQSAGELANVLDQCLAHVQQPDVQKLPRDLIVPSRPQKPRVIARVLIATALAILAVFVVVQQPWRFGKSPAEVDGSGINATTTDKSAAAPAMEEELDVFTGWDAAEMEIQQLRSLSDELSSRIDRLWNDLPTTVPDTNEPEPTFNEPIRTE
jgi:hypothetical protein